MRDRRRALLAIAMLFLAATWFDSPASRVAIKTDLTARAPTTVQAALDLGALGTIVLSWTINRLN